ncbi:hypothetical protein M409DRAFT_51482 [Zasmidium cellare ATCC 36951]|uniref:Anaphase-promoting complex subunit 11 n=1 Tax=Zasmidium cellare ATCC 36951 TaxID=1080233 RepID=A0A6A6CTL9_ZASCE|nr:uncharacterized protein M409DRAFT_51482 [Zasmidium cellare ATCC 36951]KAF2170441.1 hypothetical protein M409DRAFT_51482 [Zasmidium cellare ATCC 36951]
MMGVDTDYQSYATYPDRRGYPSQPQYGGCSAYPSSSGRAYQHPIDLTADWPPAKKRPTKRKAVALEEQYEDKPAKKKRSKPKDEEKRLKRWRPKAPLTYNEIRDRALTQRMFVIDRERYAAESEQSHPTETVTMAGTTGNIYHIIVDKVPSCDCPHAQKGNQCKHIVYVLSRVLRVPAHLEYQLAFITTELREIFDNAPPLPSETANESEKDGNRKPIEGECPICSDDFEPYNAKEKVVYCKASCGNNIHKECFDRWAATRHGARVTCPYCRAPWESDDQGDIKRVATNGRVNTEGYVNVAGQLGLSGRRDYSTYNEYWVRNQMRRGRSDYEAGWGF